VIRAGLGLLAMLLLGCDFGVIRQRVLSPLFDQTVTLLPGESKDDLMLPFAEGDTCRGWFVVQDGRQIDFLVQNREQYRAAPRDPARSTHSTSGRSEDTFAFRCPATDTFRFELFNRDSAAGRSLTLRVERIYWRRID
jgi:hypothetical protein